MARIVFTDNTGREQTLQFNKTECPLYVGRSADCFIHTNSPSVSRRHAQIAFEGGQFHIKDAGSSNGTFLNENRVSQAALSDGDVVKCGEFPLRIHFAPGDLAQDTAVGDAATQAAERVSAPRPAAQPRQPVTAGIRSSAVPDALQVDLNALVARLEDEKRRLQSQLDRVHDTSGSAERELADLREELLLRDGKMAELEGKLARQSLEAGTVTDRYAQLRDQVSLQKKLLDETREELQRREETIEEIETLKKSYEKQLENATSDSSHVQEVIAGLKINVSQRDRQIDELQNQLDLFEYELKQAREENESLLASVNRGGADVSTLENRINQLREVLTEKENVIAQLKADLAEREGEIEDVRMGVGLSQLEEEKRKLLEDYYQRDMEVTRQKEKIAEYERTISELESSASDVTQSSEYQQMVQQSEELQSQLAASESSNQDLQGEIQTLRKEVDRLYLRIDETAPKAAKAKELADQIDQLEDEKAELKQQIDKQAEQLAAAADAGGGPAAMQLRKKMELLADSLSDLMEQWQVNLLSIQNSTKDIRQCIDAYTKVDPQTLPPEASRVLKYMDPADSVEDLERGVKIVVNDAEMMGRDLSTLRTLLDQS